MSNDLFTLKRKLATCCVDGCRVPEDSEMSFHSFPKETELREKWAKALNIDVLDDSMKVCGGHFHGDDFFSTSGEFKVRKLNVKRLKRTAVPSQYLPSPMLEKALSRKEADSLVIVKVESLSPVSPEAKTEEESTANESEFAIGTFCCTNCGFIAKNEPIFLEHLYSHVKNEHCEEFEDESEDPLVIGLDEDQNNPVSEANHTQENSDDSESGEEQGMTNPDCNSNSSISSPGKRKLPKRNEPYKKQSHVCKFCFRKYHCAPNGSIFTHLCEDHKTEPEMQTIFMTKPLDLREALLRKLIIMGDYFASKFDKTLSICKFLKDPTQDQLVQDTIFGDMSSIKVSSSSEWSSVFKKPTLYFPPLPGKSSRSISIPRCAKIRPKKPFTRKQLIHGDQISSLHAAQSKVKKCNYCNFCTTDVCLATAHFQLHAEGKAFGCYGCQKYFDSERDLLVQHTTASYCSNILVLNFTLRCPQCLQIFTYKASHLYHTLYEECN